MSDKTEQSYVVLFEIIKVQCLNWKTKVYHCYFETEMINALKKVFPTILIMRCYYHFINALWRQETFLGLKAKIYRRLVGLCTRTVLPLLPEENIKEGWNYIQSECHEMQIMKTFMTYINKYWLKNEQFIKECCIYNQLHRTNNFAEG